MGMDLRVCPFNLAHAPRTISRSRAKFAEDSRQGGFRAPSLRLDRLERCRAPSSVKSRNSQTNTNPPTHPPTDDRKQNQNHFGPPRAPPPSHPAVHIQTRPGRTARALQTHLIMHGHVSRPPPPPPPPAAPRRSLLGDLKRPHERRRNARPPKPPRHAPTRKPARDRPDPRSVARSVAARYRVSNPCLVARAAARAPYSRRCARALREAARCALSPCVGAARTRALSCRDDEVKDEDAVTAAGGCVPRAVPLPLSLLSVCIARRVAAMENAGLMPYDTTNIPKNERRGRKTLRVSARPSALTRRRPHPDQVGPRARARSALAAPPSTARCRRTMHGSVSRPPPLPPPAASRRSLLSDLKRPHERRSKARLSEASAKGSHTTAYRPRGGPTCARPHHVSASPRAAPAGGLFGGCWQRRTDDAHEDADGASRAVRATE
ncbi:hypothetical protein HETIRDRAFT_461114 [Heterobasidion irregulare TC 32-1]|uniref:Uncharacterized protein n=1 Tax=Heterobasidion irregulare (strain TC 32-1) TaxID=747525 RepID=W4JSE7_HETIT|nr:uncharacterized protein HETIRDRAFT_461114 [Heterobasidion irregulare TC 32-1]ETW76035.1 hypothetical protein HETIRDRAFT_461114 [Heterobasidion irregulare TC 32-1]